MAREVTLRFTEMGTELQQEDNGVISRKMIDLNKLKEVFTSSIKLDTGLLACSEGVCRLCLNNGSALVYYLVPSYLRDITYHNAIGSATRMADGRVQYHGLQDDSVETFRIWTPPVILRMVMRPTRITRDGEQMYVTQGKGCAYVYEGGRVSHDTKIYMFPFGNVYCGSWKSDYICWGRTNEDILHMPRNLCEGMYDLAAMFWAARFNGHLHPNLYPFDIEGETIKEIRDFMCFLVDKDHFPIERLPYFSTMDTWMKRKDEGDHFA